MHMYVQCNGISNTKMGGGRETVPRIITVSQGHKTVGGGAICASSSHRLWELCLTALQEPHL